MQNYKFSDMFRALSIAFDVSSMKFALKIVEFT